MPNNPTRLPLLLIAAVCTVRITAQMITPAGTSVLIDAGTSLRIEEPLNWTMESGSTVVNNGLITLGPSTELDEAIGAAITGTGTERTTRDFNSALFSAAPGGLGTTISTNSVLGNTEIVRGHIPFTDISGHASIARWVDITPTNNSGLDATLSFGFDPAELNGMVEAEQILHIRNSGNSWSFLASILDPGQHTATVGGQDSLGTYTTFDDLLTSVNAARESGAYRLLRSTGAGWSLFVPDGRTVTRLSMLNTLGAEVMTRSLSWGPGIHELSNVPLAHGVYLVRVNDLITLPLLH